MKSLYEYRNYKDFIVDRILELKKIKRGLTYKYIASYLKLKSPGQISSIIKGNGNLTSKTMPLMANLLHLKEKEKQFFYLLVAYNQSSAMDEKRRLLTQITQVTKGSTIKVTRKQYEFYQKWYYAAIRDILAIKPFQGNYKKLGQSLCPSITALEARKAISLLEKLDLIQKDVLGVYRATSNIITTDVTEESIVILSGYADEMTRQASYAINNLEKDERTIAWAGFAISDECYKLITDEIRTFRNHILDIVKSDTNPSRAYHLNLHCFPLSNSFSKES